GAPRGVRLQEAANFPQPLRQRCRRRASLRRGGRRSCRTAPPRIPIAGRRGNRPLQFDDASMQVPNEKALRAHVGHQLLSSGSAQFVLHPPPPPNTLVCRSPFPPRGVAPASASASPRTRAHRGRAHSPSTAPLSHAQQGAKTEWGWVVKRK
ncbi:uncharacterized protein Tco025E_07681, partial [Trypanosoma conorhini]